MYSRALQNVLRVTLKLNKQNILKCDTLDGTLLMQATKGFIPYTSNCFCDSQSLNPINVLPKDPLERKEKIDEVCQKKLDDMMRENPRLEKTLQILKLEIDVMRQDGERVPSCIRPRNWIELIQLPSYYKRKRFLDYLFVIEKQQEKKKQQQLENNKVLKQIRLDRENGLSIDKDSYRIGGNHIMRRVVESTMNQLWTWNSLKALMFGNKIIFDMSYEKFMNLHEIKSCAKQLLESYAVNKIHNFPFEIILCNVNFSGDLIDKLQRYIPTLFDKDFPMTITSKSYLELFDRSKLVYLSGNSNIMLTKYDPESIYIIGAYVDKGDSKPISLGKAKEENLQAVKLPLDKYIRFGDGSSKDLTLNQVFSIMLDAQCSDWNTALQHIPRRKLFESRVHAMEKRIEKLRKKETLFSSEISYSSNITKSSDLEDKDFSYAARVKQHTQGNET